MLKLTPNIKRVTQAIACSLALLAAAAQAQPNEKPEAPMTAQWFEQGNAKWIWPGDISLPPNQYANFAQDFTLDVRSDDAHIAISVDTNYAVWLNEDFVGFGQWSNFPDDKTYDVLDLRDYIRAGVNRLRIEGYWQGQDSSTYRKGQPGIAYAVRVGNEVVAESGAETRMRPAPDYISGPVPLVTGQLGYTFIHRGDRQDAWLTADYQWAADWRAPATTETKALSTRPVRPRPIPKLVLEQRIPMRIASQGTFHRLRPKADIADAMQTDALSYSRPEHLMDPPAEMIYANNQTSFTLKSDAWKGQTGAYLLLDSRYEEAGLLDLEMDAPKGTIVDIGYGEHLDDLRVRTAIGGRNFAVRHVCPGGNHIFVHPFLRLAGRYIQLHITPAPGREAEPISLRYAGMRPTPFPAEVIGKFQSSDSLHNKIWDVSLRTLELCMHEHYEDCPWREQALYSMDGRNQALAGYYSFGNYDFAAESIRLLGQSLNPDDGLLELCAPAKIGITIPSFSLAWILMIDDHMLFRGDRDFVKSQLPIAQKLLQTLEKQTSGALLLTPTADRMWNFYEWAHGLDGADRGNKQVRSDAPLNLFYLLSLDATARMARECGQNPEPFQTKATEVRKVFHSQFWDEAEQAYVTRIGAEQKPHFTELTQALAILADVVPADKVDALREKLAGDDNGMVACTISHTLYKFEALLTNRDKYGKRVFDLIARDWGYMLSQGATSFWETIDGADAFHDAGSLCHGWSGVPAWFYGAYILGVKPTAPGFAEYQREPLKGIFDSATGVVPTPTGVIEIKE